ncbi:hypothetical protein ARMGADRAFT_90021 [Armillaria gallica]|uniref:Uncharacterized protein n=1 Tax=Armillaria gallica TaxID=47427 RepID=A0A2H3DJK8_ARMGA|nr:hypothetical protein ARMGADRAFT_90021 [Armillaria gallica]
MVSVVVARATAYSGSGASFYRFCDALEVKNSVSPESRWGVDHALSAWAKCRQTVQLMLCDSCSRAEYPVDVINSTRLYWDEPPIGWCGVVSRLNAVESDGSCVVEFPDAFPTILIPKSDSINGLYGGWYVKNERLFFADSKRDPWGEATVSAVNRTGMSTSDKLLTCQTVSIAQIWWWSSLHLILHLLLCRICSWITWLKDFMAK